MHALPHPNSHLREVFRIEDLVDMATGNREFPTLNQSLDGAEKTFAATPGAVGIWSIIMEDSGRVSLIYIEPGRRWTRHHTFGFGRTGNGSRLI